MAICNRCPLIIGLKTQIFLRRIKYPEGKKCIIYIALLGIFICHIFFDKTNISVFYGDTTAVGISLNDKMFGMLCGR